MRLLVGVDGPAPAAIVERLGALIPLRGQELVLVHVVDSRPREDLELVRARPLGRRLPPRRRHALSEAEREAAETQLDEARASAERLGAEVEVLVDEGEPGRRLTELAEERGCQLAAVQARASGHRERPGPHSVGRTARFLLDHSPCPVLLIR